MNWDEVLALVATPRYEVFSHMMTPPWKDGETLLDWMKGRVPGKGSTQVARELAESRRVLEAKLRRPVPYLAWPVGLYDEDLIRLAVEAGYRGLFTAESGVNLSGGDPLRIRRTNINGACDDSVFISILADGIRRDCLSEDPPQID